ncbi:MAG: hypothetical protein IPM69_00350 [Ignavibacteria bacterium]|nr:hypothetical protein [Ignavibacteria bacterium]
MKKLFLLPLLLSVVVSFSFSQVAPKWIKSAGSTGDDSGQSIVLDSLGNSYIIGSFTNDITFGNTKLKSNDASDIFVIKYKNDGSALWAKNFGGIAEDLGYSIACEPNGTIVFTGSIMNNAYFAADTIKSLGGTDAFIGKLTTDGTLTWIKRIGSTNDDAGRGITVDNQGNYYVTGAFSDKITFPGPSSFSITSDGGSDMFLVKYSTTGTALWAKRAGGTSLDEAHGICFDKNGFVDVAGFFWGTAKFPGGTAIDLTSTGNYDCFVVQYNLDGMPQWSKKAGGSSDDEPNAIAVDDTGTIFMTGFYTGTASFSTDVSLKLGGMFLAKYTIDGFSEGAVKIGNTESDMGKGVALDKSGNVYVIGNFYDKTDFGLSNVTDLISTGKSDVIIACLNYSGRLQWARRAGGTLNDNGNAIVSDSKGDVFVVGGFRDASSFPSGTIQDISSIGGLDVFVGRYSIPKYTILGYITLNDQPLSGVTVSDGLRTSITGTNGIYIIEDVPNGSYTVTPTKAGYNFLPEKTDIIVKDISTNEINFKAQIVLIAPELLSPPDKASKISTSIAFSWNPSLSANLYRIQVSTSPIFTTLLIDDSTLTGTSSVVSTLANSTEYYWRIAASDGTHWSNWSVVWRFTTEVEIPGKVSLSSPTNESMNIPVSTNLIWRTVTGAELYHYQLSTVEDFSVINREDSLLVVVLKPISNLDVSTKYFWRSRAKIGGLWGLWSDTWNFTTSSSVSVENTDIAANEFMVIPNPCATGILQINVTAQNDGRVIFHNLLGNIVADIPFHSTDLPSIAIDVSGLAAGIYRCSVFAGTQYNSQNVVIVR